MKTPYSAAREAYNKSALKVVTAHTTLGSIRAQGWEQHVLLHQVYEDLFEAAEALLDIEPNLLGHGIRKQLRLMSREKK